MKNLILVVSFTCLVFLNISAQVVEHSSNEDVFTWVERMPEFKGGDSVLNDYIKKNLTYPEEAKKHKVKGKVWVKFIVEKDGTLTNFEVLRGIGDGCDEEALRLVKDMPAWNPGRQGGKVVRVYYTYPVEFILK